MYILSQDRTILIRMNGVYLQLNKWTGVDKGSFFQRQVEHKEYAIMCISECEFGSDDAEVEGGLSKIHKMGTFGTESRAQQEMESIAQAILDNEAVYRIKTK